MIIVSNVRCSDCFELFHKNKRFAVIKEDKSQKYNYEERSLGAHLFQVLVCADCSGWYKDALEVPEDAHA
jgi:hypothetical protein